MTDPTLQQEAPGSPTPYPVFFGPEGLRPGWGLLLYIAVLATLLLAATAIARPFHHTATPHEQSPRALLLNDGILFLVTAAATAIMARVERRPFTAYGLGGTRRLARFLAGLAWGAAFLSLLVLALKLTGLLVFDARLLSGPAILRFSAVWLAGFLLVALLEETLLRGYLQFTLARGLTGLFSGLSVNHTSLGFWAAALLLSLVFGLGHGSNPGESPLGLAAATLAGLVFCLSLWRTGSLWWAIGFHATWDWAQSFLYGVADSGTMVQCHLFATHPHGKTLLSGGATGPEGSLFILPVLSLVAAVILLTLPQAQPMRLDS